MIKKALSPRQLEVMEALWNSPNGMTASVIVESNDELQINTVQASLRSLIKKKYVKVGEIVYSGTVLARSYVPLVSKEEYLESRCQVLTQISSASIPMLMVSFINEQKDEQMLDEMEKMIAQRRKEIEKGQ